MTAPETSSPSGRLANLMNPDGVAIVGYPLLTGDAVLVADR